MAAQIEPRLKARTLTVSGVAKSYAMMGWRVGYAGGPTDLIAAMASLDGGVVSDVTILSGGTLELDGGAVASAFNLASGGFLPGRRR